MYCYDVHVCMCEMDTVVRALSSLLSKIFDNCIISNQYDSLFTNDLQFAYKSKLLQFIV